MLAAAAGQSHNAAMKVWLLSSLAVLASAVGVVSGNAAASGSAAAAMEPTVTLRRCTDARGKVTWQDDPCPKGSTELVREMIRPLDPPRSKAKPAPAPVAPPVAYDPPPRTRELIPPPAMYKCTSYDGNERYSESYDPNPRCEPMVIYYPYPNLLTPAQALSCRWVEDSCVRLSDRAACLRWREKHKEAVSLLQRSFSDTAEYRKSELARINQIVEDSCP